MTATAYCVYESMKAVRLPPSLIRTTTLKDYSLAFLRAGEVIFTEEASSTQRTVTLPMNATTDLITRIGVLRTKEVNKEQYTTIIIGRRKYKSKKGKRKGKKDKRKGKKGKRKHYKHKKKAKKTTTIVPKITKSIRPYVKPAYATKKINYVPPAYVQKRTSITSAHTENSCHLP